MIIFFVNVILFSFLGKPMKYLNKYLVGSFVVAFSLSLISLVYLYPEVSNLLYTDSVANLPALSPTFFVKVFLTLAGQTTMLGAVFYTIAKKLF